MITIDMELLVLAVTGGLIFGTAVISLIKMSGIFLPPLHAMWKTYIALSVLFFIAYYGAIYANRAIDGNNLFHSTPTSLIAYTAFTIGMILSSVIDEYRRSRNGP